MAAMKIVDVSGFYSESGGGVRSYVRQKLRMAALWGHEVTVVAPGREDRTEPREGGKIVWVASPAMPFDDAYRVFRHAGPVWRILDAEAPDVVEGSSPWRGGQIAGRWPGDAVKSMVFHQDFVAGYPHVVLDRLLPRPAIDGLFGPYWAYARRLSARFDVTIAGGDWLASRLRAQGLKNPVSVPLGIEADRFSPTKRDEAMRADLLARCGVPASGRLLLAVGRLHPEKRHGAIIEGFAAARASRSDLGLVIVGEGLARPHVERRAARAGHVHMAGAVEDRETLARLYASADLLVHGSGAETYGLVVGEAIASGLAVVVPDVGGAADFAVRGRAQVYRTGDWAACAAAILRALDQGPDGAGNEVGGGGAALPSAGDHFAALFDLYRRLIERRAAGALTSPGRAGE